MCITFNTNRNENAQREIETILLTRILPGNTPMDTQRWKYPPLICEIQLK